MPAIAKAAAAVAAATTSLTGIITPGAPIASGFEYSGCVASTTPSGALSQASLRSDNGMTIETCLSFCSSKNFPVAGIQSGHTCKCGDQLESETTYLQADQCWLPCSGAQEQLCGGGSTMSTFVNKKLLDANSIVKAATKTNTPMEVENLKIREPHDFHPNVAPGDIKGGVLKYDHSVNPSISITNHHAGEPGSLPRSQPFELPKNRLPTTGDSGTSDALPLRLKGSPGHPSIAQRHEGPATGPIVAYAAALKEGLEKLGPYALGAFKGPTKRWTEWINTI